MSVGFVTKESIRGYIESKEYVVILKDFGKHLLSSIIAETMNTTTTYFVDKISGRHQVIEMPSKEE